MQKECFLVPGVLILSVSTLIIMADRLCHVLFHLGTWLYWPKNIDQVFRFGCLNFPDTA